MIAVLALVAAACSSDEQRRAASSSGSTSTIRARRPRRPTSSSSSTGCPTPTTWACTTPRTRGTSTTPASRSSSGRRPTPPTRSSSSASNKVDLAITYEPEMFYGQQNEPAGRRGRDRRAGAAELDDRAPGRDRRPHSAADRRASRSASPGSRATTRSTTTMLKTAGLTEDDVTKVNVGLQPGALAAVEQGRRDHRRVPQRRGDPDRAGVRARSPRCSRRTSWACRRYAELVVVANSDRLASPTPRTPTR